MHASAMRSLASRSAVARRLFSRCVHSASTSIPKRELDKAQIRQLSTCRWVVEHQNVLVTGATGTGKTYVACALAQQACRKGHRAIYRRASRLFSELGLARADGSYPRLLVSEHAPGVSPPTCCCARAVAVAA